ALLTTLISPMGLITQSQLAAWKPATAVLADKASTVNAKRSNWFILGAAPSVVGGLGWSQAGDGYSIIDASSGLSPEGTAINA
ncbi:hypothetical protein ACXWPE_09640, partial [Streptococcus pyogenes]